MSLPLPYGKKPTGVEREPPAKGGPRPYADRLVQVPDLVDKAGPSRSTVVSALPGAAAVLMVLGAVAPIAYAHPDIRAVLFQPLVDATYPASGGLAIAADAVWYGWAAGLILLVAAVAGYLALVLGNALGRQRRAAGRPAGDRLRLLLLLGGLAAGVVIGFFVVTLGVGAAGDLGQPAAAAWVLITAAAGAYGAWHAQSRSNYLGSVGGAVALIIGGRFIFGGVALLCLALSDKEFPGQRVAPYSWSRSQVSIDPVRAPAGPMYKDEDWDKIHRARWALPSAPPLAGLLLLVGALVPFGYWEPFRGVFFGPLVGALQPLATFVPIVSDAFWSLEPVFAAYILLTSVVAVGAARFAFGARRPAAVVAGAVALLASGRVITGVAVLVILLFSYAEYDQEQAAAEGAHAGDAADTGPSAN